MGDSLMSFRAFDKDGAFCEGGTVFLPAYLDWMPIQVKAEYFRLRGFGNPKIQDVLLESQGQSLLVRDVALSIVKWDLLQEKASGIESKISDFIRVHGYSRDPRNQ
jgi:hypothetical protein